MVHLFITAWSIYLSRLGPFIFYSLFHLSWSVYQVVVATEEEFQASHSWDRIVFPHQLLLCFRINYYYGPITLKRNQNTRWWLKRKRRSSRPRTMPGEARESKSRLPLRYIPSIAFPYQPLLYFRINYYYASVSAITMSPYQLSLWSYHIRSTAGAQRPEERRD